VAAHGVDTDAFQPWSGARPLDAGDRSTRGTSGTNGSAAAEAAAAEAEAATAAAWRRRCLRAKWLGFAFRTAWAAAGGHARGDGCDRAAASADAAAASQACEGSPAGAECPTEVAAAAESRLAAQDARVVFLHVGAMTPNKGVPKLVAAFEGVLAAWPALTAAANADAEEAEEAEEAAPRRPPAVEHHPPVLLLKGLDGLYPSVAAAALAPALLASGAVVYCGEDLNLRELAELYAAADVYASAASAEGFGLPLVRSKTP
jgi:glycosyltransferase involved in cell wall biosynthesis